MALSDQQIQFLHSTVVGVSTKSPTLKNSTIYDKKQDKRIKSSTAPQVIPTVTMSPKPLQLHRVIQVGRM